MSQNKPLTETTLRNYEYTKQEDDLIGDGFSIDDVRSAVEGLKKEVLTINNARMARMLIDKWFHVFEEKQ